jgi:steroid 5-alpha reductase family enzyme
MQENEKRKNKIKILYSGLWKYSRHPNYFGDSLFWWGITIYCFALSNNLLIFIAPIIMTYLLLRVSGVTMLENRLSKKKDGYTEYINSTSSFIILPKKKSK